MNNVFPEIDCRVYRPAQVSERIPKQRAAKMLEQARLLLERGDFARAEAIAKDVVEHGDLKTAYGDALWGEALAQQDRRDEAIAVFRRGLEKFAHDPDLISRLAIQLSRAGQHEEALPLFERSKKGRERDPAFLSQWAASLVQRGQLEEAERLAIRAASSGGNPENKLMLAVIRGKLGRYADAEKLFLEIERHPSAREPVVAAARAARADARLFQNDALGALEVWRVLRAAGKLPPEHLGHMAYAAQLAGDPKLSDELVAERMKGRPEAEDLLLFAQIANLRGQPELALRNLEASERTAGARHLAHGFEVTATRGRALRMLGKAQEARTLLTGLIESPEGKSARLGPQVFVDLGHLAAEEGDFETAETHFRAALEMDPGEPEAGRALALTERRVAWRSELAASADAKVESARAEAEAMRRRFSAREGELSQLRKELERVEAAKREAEAKAKAAEARADQIRAAEAAQRQQRVREEIDQREVEAEEKTAANLDRALGEAKAHCPPAVLDALKVAERTFQKALYTELPAAAVAVLYTGALERALYTFFVDRFGRWLKEKGRLDDFLKAAIRERRGTRVEYFDHFVEAFDEDRPGKAPSMGEVGRVLQKRNEPHLRAFRDFLNESYRPEDGFYEALAALVLSSKEELRDPIAHGRMDQVGYEQLKRFREQFLFDFGATGKGALASLLS